MFGSALLSSDWNPNPNIFQSLRAELTSAALMRARLQRSRNFLMTQSHVENNWNFKWAL